VQIILTNPGTAGGTPYPPCAAISEISNPPCVPVLKHSCQNMAEPVFYAEPAVRLNAVVNAVESHSIYSLCDANYTEAMNGISAAIASQLGACCLPSAPSPELDCVVEEITTALDGSTTTTAIPACSLGATPCWRIENKVDCTGVGVTVDRGGAVAPPRTHTRAACVAAG
jgi:hypothetical protein